LPVYPSISFDYSIIVTAYFNVQENRSTTAQLELPLKHLVHKTLSQ